MFNGGDTNLYGYVLNDPINSIDPPRTGPIAGMICFQASPYVVRGAMLGIFDIYQREIDKLNNAKGSCDSPEQAKKIDDNIASLRVQQAVFTSAGTSMATWGMRMLCSGLLVAPNIP